MTLTALSRLLACALLLALTGCGSTRITDAWQSPKFEGKMLDNVLVVGVTQNKTKRILFERAFVSALSAKGIKSTASYDVIGGATPTRESVSKYLANSNIRYVIVSQYSGKETTAEYVPESVTTYYTGPYYPSFGSYWSHNDTTTMTREAYVSTRSQVVLTTSIYDAKSEQLVWAGRSNTFEAHSIAHASNELAGRVLDSIKQ